MTRKPKKSTKRPEIEKITLNVIHLFSIYNRKIRHSSNLLSSFRIHFSHFITSCENFQKIQLFSLQVKKSLL